jgi:glyoxylase-like metal-dependent hydrolase (beta-lactamase superfamily II)
MPSYQILNDDILTIDTEQVRPQLAACYLIRGGDRYAFVECGTSLSVPAILHVLSERGVARDAVDYVMPTHVHLDHAGGAGALMRELPNARLVIHPRGARHMIDPSRLIAGATAVYGADFMRRMYGEIVPVPEERVIVADVGPERDFSLALGDREFLFIDVPGHARHHYAVWDELSRGWFTGDTFGISYRDFDAPGQSPYMLPTTTPVDFDPPAWEHSLQRLLDKQPAHMYLTHYGRVDDVAARAADLRRGLADYQRMARELADAPARHARLRARLLDYHVQQLRDLHHPLPEARIRELLAPDSEINAQGLEVWLDRQKRAGAQ